MQNAINKQVRDELYSAYLYLSMAAYFETESLPGFSRWMRLQSEEEVGHAMKLFDFVNERGGEVQLHAIEKPPSEFRSPRHVFEETLAHEQKVTRLINDLYKVALEEDDYAAQVMLHWFIDEQVEEEDSVSQILDVLERIGDRDQGLLMLDRELGGREG
jgi:ferritin